MVARALLLNAAGANLRADARCTVAPLHLELELLEQAVDLHNVVPLQAADLEVRAMRRATRHVLGLEVAEDEVDKRACLEEGRRGGVEVEEESLRARADRPRSNKSAE